MENVKEELLNRIKIVREQEKKIVSEKAKKIGEFIDNSDFGCQTPNVRRLVSLIIDEELSEKSDLEIVENGFYFFRETPCIAWTNSSYIYPIFLKDGNIRESQSEVDNDLKEMREGTREELESWLDSMSQNNLSILLLWFNKSIRLLEDEID